MPTAELSHEELVKATASACRDWQRAANRVCALREQGSRIVSFPEWDRFRLAYSGAVYWEREEWGRYQRLITMRDAATLALLSDNNVMAL